VLRIWNLGERVSVIIVAKKNRIKESLRTIFNHYRDKIDFSKTVFLKPNIVFPVNDKTGEITRLAVVKSVVDILREEFHTHRIVIGEGTAAGTNPLTNFKVSGYRELAGQLKVELLDLHEAERTPVKWKHGILDLPRILFDSTYINLPILKMSSAALMSGAMKNQKGLINPEMKKRFHRLGLHEPIAALAETVRPHLTIMDGYNFFRNDAFFASDNFYEIDHLVIGLLGGDQPEYLRIAKDYGLGNDAYEIVGREFAERNNKTFEHQKCKDYFRLRLWSNPAACSMCRFTLESLRHWPTTSFYHSFLVYAKLLRWLVKGADFVFGSKPEFDRGRKNIICIGDCTKKVAKSNKYRHVPGCPPTRASLSRHL
jgi:hypothetical protein